jgi:hypothetical protein
MKQNQTEKFVYSIDSKDRIRFISDTWVTFAIENDAKNLTQTTVIGSSIWDHIASEEVRYLYKKIFSKLRGANTELILPFRCDSPEVVRHMELTMRSKPANGIEMEGRLIRKIHREPVRLLVTNVDRSNEFIKICSVCRKIMMRHGDWVEIENAVTQLRIFTKPRLPKLEESICTSCKKLLENAANDY